MVSIDGKYRKDVVSIKEPADYDDILEISIHFYINLKMILMNLIMGC
jgi:hypothetical protein